MNTIHFVRTDGRRGVISPFSLGGKFFNLFFNSTGLLKNWEKQHFIIM